MDPCLCQNDSCTCFDLQTFNSTYSSIPKFKHLVLTCMHAFCFNLLFRKCTVVSIYADSFVIFKHIVKKDPPKRVTLNRFHIFSKHSTIKSKDSVFPLFSKNIESLKLNFTDFFTFLHVLQCTLS